MNQQCASPKKAFKTRRRILQKEIREENTLRRKLKRQTPTQIGLYRLTPKEQQILQRALRRKLNKDLWGT